jgi:hypothetical protein
VATNLLLLLGLLSSFVAQENALPSPDAVWKNFDPRLVVQRGYQVQQRDGRWYLRVWADEAPSDDCSAKIHAKTPDMAKNIPCSYLLLLSVTNTRKAAIKNGEKWLNDGEKILKSAHKERK